MLPPVDTDTRLPLAGAEHTGSRAALGQGHGAGQDMYQIGQIGTHLSLFVAACGIRQRAIMGVATGNDHLMGGNAGQALDGGAHCLYVAGPQVEQVTGDQGQMPHRGR